MFVPHQTLANIGHYLEQKRLAMRSHLPDMPDLALDAGTDSTSEKGPTGQGALVSEIAVADAPAKPAEKVPDCIDRGPRFQSVVAGEPCGSDGLLKHGKEPPAIETKPGAGQ